MKETEITVQVFDDEKTINEKLMANGYVASREFKLFDWYFTKYDDVKSMTYEDLINSSFLIRHIEDEDGFEIALQKIEGLGFFFEIEEDDSLSGLNSEEKFEELSRIVKNLGLNIGNDFSCKKPFMLLKK